MLEERVARGDLQAREEIFNRSLRFLFKAAGKRADGDPDLLMDLFQDEALCATNALKNWEPGKGSYLTYVNYSTEGAINRHFQKNGNRSSKTNGNNDFDSGSTYKEAAASKNENSPGSFEREFTQAGFTFDDVEECEIADPQSNPEEIVIAKRITLEFIELRDQLLKCLEYHISRIKKIRHRTFFSMILSHDGLLNCVFPRLLGKEVKTCNYAELHLDWYIKFLEEEISEEVKNWQRSKITRKFTNTLNDIWQRHLRDSIYQDEKARILIARIIEMIKNDADLFITF